MAEREEVRRCNRETEEHIAVVERLLAGIRHDLMIRGWTHDASKLAEPEVDALAATLPRLRGTTYGSSQYAELLSELRPALKHHYAVNSHHPEHHAAGILGMTLMDLCEMLADWMAATERHADGDIWRSLEVNQQRFLIPDALVAVLSNTVRALRPGGREKETA